MILIDVTLENYKQYAETQTVVIPTEATIGVVGRNGVGKTTLFEAIEWCLYNPARIANSDVRPRGSGANPKVTVRMEDPTTGQRYLVERELKGRSIKAAIYRLEENGDVTKLVDGTRPVTDYVATRLIGLSHQAFCATFFTRQKELSFFGDLKETARRREVSRMLGVDVIRDAQSSIGEERAKVRATGNALRAQYESEANARDFAAELECAERTIAEFLAASEQATRTLSCAQQRLTETSARRTALLALKDQDNELHRQLIGAEGEIASLRERQRGIEGDLRFLDQRQAELQTLQPLAANLATLKQSQEELDVLRERHLRRMQLGDELKRKQTERQRFATDLKRQVHGVQPPEPNSQWRWWSEDDQDPLRAAVRLREVARTVDVAGAEQAATALRACLDASSNQQKAEAKLQTYEIRRQAIEDKLAALSQQGDPREELVTLAAKRDRAWSARTQEQTHLTNVQQERAKTEKLQRNLERADFSDGCPTCLRPFSAADARDMLGILASNFRELSVAEMQHKTRITAADREITRIDGRLAEVKSIGEQWQELQGRIAASEPHLAEAREELTNADHALAEALRAARRQQAPTTMETEQAAERATALRRLANLAVTLDTIATQLTTNEEESTSLDADLRAMGDDTYDPAAHQRVKLDLDRAQTAAATIAAITEELVRRPQQEAHLGTCVEQLGALAERRDCLTEQRSGLGFQEFDLSAATEAEQAAQTAEREAGAGVHAAVREFERAQSRREQIETDRVKLDELAKNADIRTREADQLERMYKEFNEFEKYVAMRYTPVLAEMTSELVREVTDGKYDRVEYDENYGIQVYDGGEECFPIEGFSGGERDAIALCARLAFSRMIGSQAASPPGFLVLDEVFGSLDRDRRTRLLDMLGQLTNAMNAFRQVFVISHVDDVKAAAIFDEIWRVEESIDGASRIDNVTLNEIAVEEI